MRSDRHFHKGFGRINRAYRYTGPIADGGGLYVITDNSKAVAIDKSDVGKADRPDRAFNVRQGGKMIAKFLKTLFGMDPVLLDSVKRIERLEGTIDGDVDWMLVCKPRRKTDHIKCNNGDEYRRLRKDNG